MPSRIVQTAHHHNACIASRHRPASLPFLNRSVAARCRFNASTVASKKLAHAAALWTQRSLAVSAARCVVRASAQNDDAIELDIKIGGMVCGGCSDRAEQALKAADGVRLANVNLETGIATVNVQAVDPHDAATNAMPRLLDLVEQLGFTASPWFGESNPSE